MREFDKSNDDKDIEMKIYKIVEMTVLLDEEAPTDASNSNGKEEKKEIVSKTFKASPAVKKETQITATSKPKQSEPSGLDILEELEDLQLEEI